MKKKIICLLLVSLMSLSVCGCSKRKVFEEEVKITAIRDEKFDNYVFFELDGVLHKCNASKTFCNYLEEHIGENVKLRLGISEYNEMYYIVES